MPRGRPRKNQGDVLIKSAELLGWAVGGLEREIALTRERLSALTAQANALRSKMGTAVTNATSSGGGAGESDATGGGTAKRKRRKMSPEARKRISEMMKKRWAERKRGK